MIGTLDDVHHERLWRICDALVSGGGARAAMVCDASTGSILVCVGDATAAGAVSGVEALGPGERVVHGDGGEFYGVDIPGGALLAVLHDQDAVERVRAAAAKAVGEAAELIAHLPPPPPWPHVHAGDEKVASTGTPMPPAAKKPASRAGPLRKKRRAARAAPASKKKRAAKAAPARKQTRAAKPALARTKKRAASTPRRKPAPPSRKTAPKMRPAPKKKKGPAKKARPSRKRPR